MNSPRISFSSSQNKFSNLREIVQRAQNDPGSNWNIRKSLSLTAQRKHSMKFEDSYTNGVPLSGFKFEKQGMLNIH
jgi:hypothetical protein